VQLVGSLRGKFHGILPTISFRPLLALEETNVHLYEVRPRKDYRGVDLISDVLPFGRLWYEQAKPSQRCNQLRKVLQPARSSRRRLYARNSNAGR
jgi:hypothetical protein